MQASFEPLGLTIAVAKDRAIESLMQVCFLDALICTGTMPAKSMSCGILFMIYDHKATRVDLLLDGIKCTAYICFIVYLQSKHTTIGLLFLAGW